MPNRKRNTYFIRHSRFTRGRKVISGLRVSAWVTFPTFRYYTGLRITKLIPGLMFDAEYIVHCQSGNVMGTISNFSQFLVAVPLSAWQVAVSEASLDETICVIADPKRGRKSLVKDSICHLTNTHSCPPLNK